MEMQRYEEALAYFDEAIRLYGSYYGSYNNKGVTLGFLGKHAEAIEFFDKAVKLSGDDTGPLSNRALANLKTGREEEALADIGEALRKHSRDPRAIDIKCFILYSQGH